MSAGSDDIDRIARKIRQVYVRLAERVMTRIAARAAGNMIKGSPGRDASGKFTAAPAHPTQLTIRSGRLMRSITGARGLAWSSPESFRSLQVTETKLVAEFGTSVPYAGVHEYGHGGYSLVPTPRQRRFFWAMFYASQERRWRAMALARQLKHRSYGGRPFVGPAVDATETEIPRLFGEVMREVFA